MINLEVPDRPAREQAESTFDRNVVVVAGAGTGKTTLLVNRLIHLLMKEPQPIPITQIVALTFTNKAAAEMKQRLRERLTALTRPATGQEPEGGAVSVQNLQQRYRITARDVADRATAALRDLEKAQIGTLHSFAAHLLRLHPLESGVDPAFREDDGLRFDEQFRTAWDLWIDEELGRGGVHHRRWKTVLGLASLDDLRAFARSLCSDLIDVDAILRQLASAQCDPLVLRRLTALRDRAQALLDRHDLPKRRKIEQMLAASVTRLSRLIEEGPDSVSNGTEDEQDWLSKTPGTGVGGWEKSEFSEAVSIIEITQSCQSVDRLFFKDLLELVLPIVHHVRTSFAQKGWLSFDGLLAQARALLYTHPAVRDRVKRDYRAVLVDEFQDTDPVQYEILLALSERVDTHAATWQAMNIEPGKLFIVGDPKQSIYAFRRADIEAFDRVVEKLSADGGLVLPLATNFRSAAAVLGPINDLFDRLFDRRPHVQPPNVRLHARPHRRPSEIPSGVELRVVVPPEDEAFDAAGALRAEATVLARWLKERIEADQGVKPGHIALLFRKLTQADAYVDALRRQGIAYVIEGEKHFYRRQEVIDFVNVLRVLDHPHDAIAFTGVLRGPLGGLTDREIYDLRTAGAFDYRRMPAMPSWPAARAASVRRLCAQLHALHRTAAALPLDDAVRLIFDRLPILELAAASLHGEQAAANLLKVRQLAAGLADRPHLTLSAFADLMTERLDEQPEEAESPLAEESPDAVQILTIHKAKGLEFPIVVMPALHQGAGGERAAPTVTFDWSSGLYGLALADRCTIGAVVLGQKQAEREEAERRRLLYVGMTRAKDFLLLSGSATKRASGTSLLTLLAEAGEGDLGGAETRAIRIGDSLIPHAAVTAPDRPGARCGRGQRPVGPSIDPAVVAMRWQSRDAAWRLACATLRHRTPTTLAAEHTHPASGPSDDASDRELGRLIGIVTHRILERWDFTLDQAGLAGEIADAISGTLADTQRHLVPSLTETVRAVLTTFGRSDLYARLQRAVILGREVPFLMPWEQRAVMAGTIDVIYRLDGAIWIADYKTDSVTPDQAPARAETYRAQGDVYKSAVRRALGVDQAGFQCFFLRCATAVEL